MLTLLALLASMLWGISDFAAGHTARSLRPAAVVGVSQAISVVVLTAVALPALLEVELGSWLGWAVGAGFGGALGLLCFYAALADGTMGVVAPIAGLGAVVPVVLGVLGGEAPSALTWAGILLALTGGVLCGGPELGGGTSARPILLAVLAAIGFGTVLYGIDRGSRQALAPTLVAERWTIVLVFAALALITRSGIGGVQRSHLRILTVIGITDLLANGMYAIASSSGLVSVASVLGSLYPVWTTALAAWLLHERLRAVQWSGVALTVVGICAIGLG